MRKLHFLDKLWILVRSSGVGLIATASDLGTLLLLKLAFGLPNKYANVLSLLPGLVIMFFGNKYFAFQDHSKHVVKQGGRFLFVEAWAFALNALLFQVIASETRMPEDENFLAVLLRMGCTSVVYFGFSFPFWTFIFHKTIVHPELPKNG